MIKINLKDLERSLKIKLEKKGFEYVKRRSSELKEELEDTARLWLMASRQLLGRSAVIGERASGNYPRTYKYLARGSYKTNKINPNNFLIDSVFYKIVRRVNNKSVTISVSRGFKEDFTMANSKHGVYDYAKALDQGKYEGYQERITDSLDQRVDLLLSKRRFIDG